MVARPGGYQASLNSGELSPNVWGRSDIKQFYSGASQMQNALPVPQGGCDNMPGSVETGYVRGTLNALGVTELRTLGPHSGPAVLIVQSFAAAFVECVDVVGYLGDVGTGTDLVVETSLDGVNWTLLGRAITYGAGAETRRCAARPGAPQRATQIRLRYTGTPPSPVTFDVVSVSVFNEAAPALIGRSFEHTYSAEVSYTVVMTPGHADIWKGDEFVAAVRTPFIAGHIQGLTREQRLETMFVFFPDVLPQRIRRRFSDFEWSCEDAAWQNVPQTDYGAAYGNIVSEVWRLALTYSSGPAGLRLDMTVNGEDIVSVALIGAPDWGDFTTNLKNAIEGAPSVEAGIAVSLLSSGATSAEIEIVFNGNGGARFSLAPRIVNVTWAAATASRTLLGDPGGEAIMSSGRGWPSTGAFYQDRLVLAGFRDIPGGVLASVSGEYFDLNAKLENAAGAILFRIDTSGAERIAFLARSKHLVIFTNEAEYFVTDRALSRSTVPNIAQSSRNGVALGVRPVESENSLLYVDKSRSIVFAATYSDVAQSYESEPISLLASHLVEGVACAALQRVSDSTDAARYWLVRADGLLVCGVMIRNQEVVAFVRWQTEGRVRDVVVDGANRSFVLVERTIAGVNRLMRERLDDDELLHQAHRFVYGAPQTIISGLGSLEGASVWAICDGHAEGPFTVAGGAITIPYASSSVTVGRWTPPIVDTLPLPRLIGERVVLQRPVRVHTVRVRLQGATSLAIGANGRPVRDVALVKGGEVSDRPVQPRFDDVCVSGLFGWSNDGIVRLTQTRPGRFRIRSITVEART